ncbi:MAG: hypothetical protein QE278_10850 [Limnobacter sp.]|nr:hypothetical protein [Limnobacter sp.]
MLTFLVMGCSPRNSLNAENLLRGARAETHILSHGALCARLPTLDAIDLYARNAIPDTSAVGRTVKTWDLSGLLDIVRAQDGRWIVLPSEGLKKLKGIHFRKGPSGENDALCFGRLWIERTIDFTENKALGVDDAVSARFEASLKDAEMLKYFRGLLVEPFDPNTFTLSTGTAYAETLSPRFSLEMSLRPTQTGWYLAKGASGLGATP